MPGRLSIRIKVGEGLTALAVGAGGGCLDNFTLYPFFPLSPSLSETARYRLKYCLKGFLNQKQQTNQSLKDITACWVPFSAYYVSLNENNPEISNGWGKRIKQKTRETV